MHKLLLTISLLLPATTASAVTLSLTQANQAGLPGDTVGWGFSLLNDTGGYLVVTSVQSTFADAPLGISATNPAVEDYLSNWMVNNSFALAPGGTLAQAFSQSLGEGLGAFAIAVGASGSEAGALIVTYSLYNADPFLDPQAIARFPDPNPLTANASVTVGSPVPEPGTWMLMALGMGWLMRRRVIVALGLAACVFGQLPGIDGVPADGSFPAPVVVSAGTVNCSVSQQPLTVRQEGAAELVGDVVMNCTGPLSVNPRNRVAPISTAAAAEAPRVNIRIQLPFGTFTNRLLAGNLTEALLLHDEVFPGMPCPSPAVDASSGVCTGLFAADSVSQSGLTGLSASGPPITVFQGLLTAPNVIDFLAVPFSWIDGLGNPKLLNAYNFVRASNGGVYSGQPIQVQANQVFRLKNLRVAASAFSGSEQESVEGP